MVKNISSGEGRIRSHMFACVSGDIERLHFPLLDLLTVVLLLGSRFYALPWLLHGSFLVAPVFIDVWRLVVPWLLSACFRTASWSVSGYFGQFWVMFGSF